MTESIAWDAPETILACRMLFRQRAVDESRGLPAGVLRSSPHDYLRRPAGLAWLYGLQLAPPVPVRSTYSTGRERRSWAVWKRKRRARKK